MAVGAGSVLARSSYKNVSFSLSESATEQKQPGVSVTSPAEGRGQARSCLQVQTIYGHIVWAPPSAAPSQRRVPTRKPLTRGPAGAAAAPAWTLSCAHAGSSASALARSVVQVWFLGTEV